MNQISKEIKRALITGVTGGGGSYLAEHIAEFHPEVEIHGISRWHSTSSLRNLKNISQKLILHECDLNDLSAIFTIVKEVRPDAIFHMASYANVRASFVTPLAVIQNNIMSTANLFEAIRMANIDPITQLCSTSEVYGLVDPKFVPIKEDTPLQPVSPYAVSKATQDFLGWSYFKNYNMKIIRTRMFAYLNPRRADLFASSFARQIVRIELGLQEELLHGNLDSVRTLIDVRDAMEAYWLAVLKCQPGETYNIGGTTIMPVGKFLECLIDKAKVPIRTRLDPRLLRPSDVTLQIPSVEKFVKVTGWRPKYSFAESLENLLNYWRENVSKEQNEKMI